MAFLTAAIAVGEINDLPDSTQDAIDDSDRLHNQSSVIPDTPDLVTQSRAVAGFLIALALVVIFYAGMVIVVRLVNLFLVNKYILFFLVTVRKCRNLPINPLPTNDAPMRHDLCELSISIWEFIWGV